MSKVYLAGAGPGDPGLITVKARDVLAQADVVLYDHLANEALLDLAPAGCERIYVGKKRAEHVTSQEEICRLMIDRARRGLTVVRLKGGDPYLFGRGGEEVEALADAGLDFEVIPGVTSALGIAAYTGVPLTHRDHTSVVTFVTGHEVAHIDWARAGRAETLVIFMGLTNLREIAREVIAHGRAASTPAMAVRWATRPDQQTIAGTLEDLPDRVEAAALKPPATIVIGDVVRLRDRLNWFERLPLFGRRIVVTRAPEDAGEFSAKLRALGASVQELPVISFAPPEDYAPLDRAIATLETYDWVIFTSANGVRFFLDRLDHSTRDLRALRGRLCAIGPATRQALEALHLKVDLTPPEHVAEGVVEAFQKLGVSGSRVLLPRASIARDVIPEQLRKMGAEVDIADTYRTVIPPGAEGRVSTLFQAGQKPHWVTFTSSSTVKNFLAVAGRDALDGVRVASIGPVTSATARSHGLIVHAEAANNTIDGLIEALLRALQ